MGNASLYIRAFAGSLSSLDMLEWKIIYVLKLTFLILFFFRALFSNILNSSVSVRLENCINAAI